LKTYTLLKFIEPSHWLDLGVALSRHLS